jgi:hypothetical protein
MIKSFTDLEQSKKFAVFLPPESADMYYYDNLPVPKVGYSIEVEKLYNKANIDYIPCWSLAALLKYLSEIKPQVYTPVLFPSEGKWILQFAEYGHGNVCETTSENPIDACVAIIEKLNELNLL